MQETSEQLNLMNYLKPIAIVSDFRVRLFRLQELEEASMILEELSYLKSCGLLKNGDLDCYSLKMSQDCSITWGGYVYNNYQGNARIGVLRGMASA